MSRKALTVRGENWSVLPRVGTPEARRDFLTESGSRLILIHGFANPVEAAHNKFSSFTRTLENVLYPNRLQDAASVWEYHWPGNHPKKAMDPASYATRIHAADQAGDRLADLLIELSGEDVVLIVAHSMGCRVALSTLRGLVNYAMGGGPSILADLRPAGPRLYVFLLAAAVPVEDCIIIEDQLRGMDESMEAHLARFSSGLPFSWRRDNTHCTVIHSAKDMVLRECFPPGQMIHSKSAVAVGLTGGPYPEGGLQDRWDVRHRTELGHSGYWSSSAVASLIVDELHPGWRRYVRVWPAAPESREMVRRALATRDLHSRVLARR